MCALHTGARQDTVRSPPRELLVAPPSGLCVCQLNPEGRVWCPRDCECPSSCTFSPSPLLDPGDRSVLTCSACHRGTWNRGQVECGRRIGALAETVVPAPCLSLSAGVNGTASSVRGQRALKTSLLPGDLSF